MPILYLVATPIGNLEDITLRALRVLQEVDLIAAEDTRTTRKLLAHYHIRKPLTSYHEHNQAAKTPGLVEELATKDIALVTEAGMPGISDPGVYLVRAAVEAGFRVVPIPGPSALVAALAVSALDTRQFTFVGFLPSRSRERRQALEGLAREERTLVLFEAPHRLRDTLEEVLAVLGDRPMAAARELTKLHEEVFRGTISQALAHFEQPRGEFTLVIQGAVHQTVEPKEAEVLEVLRGLRQRGLGAREAVAQVSQRYGLPHRQLYRMWVELGRG